MMLKIKFPLKKMKINNPMRLFQDLATGLTRRQRDPVAANSKEIAADRTGGDPPSKGKSL